MIGDAEAVADHVCLLGQCVRCRSSPQSRWRHRPRCRGNERCSRSSSEQQLHSPEIARPPIDQHRLRASQRVGAELGRIESDAGHPLLYEPCVLPRRQSPRAVTPASKQKLSRLPSGQPQVLVDCHAGLVCQFEAHRPARLFLPDGCAIHRVATRSHIVNADGDDITAAQLAIDRQIEEREVALLALDLQLGPDQPDVARSQWRFGAAELALVPGLAAGGSLVGRQLIAFHGLSPCLRDRAACAIHNLTHWHQDSFRTNSSVDWLPPVEFDPFLPSVRLASFESQSPPLIETVGTDTRRAPGARAHCRPR